MVTGETSDISPICGLEWYEWVKYRDHIAPHPEDKVKLGRYVGPSIDVGPAMSIKILKSNGQIEHHSSYRSLTPEEVISPVLKKEQEAFDAEIERRLGPAGKSSDFTDDEGVVTPEYPLYEDDDDGVVDTFPDADDIDDPISEMGDIYVGAEVLLPVGGQELTGTVRRRKRDKDGNLPGRAHNNPILDTRTYEVEFADGSVAEYSANTIAENMYAQCDMDGNQHILMDSIVDYRKSGDAVSMADKYFIKNGRQYAWKTTKG